MSKKIKQTKYSKQKSIEKNLVSTLNILLSKHPLITGITEGDDTFPNIDGYIHLLQVNRETTGDILQVQVKPAEKKKRGYCSSFRPELLAYASSSSTPVLLIGVDGKKQVASWLYLSPELISKYIEKTPKIPEKKVTFYFPANQVIQSDTENLLSEWKRICAHHKNKRNDDLISGFDEHVKKYADSSIRIERLKILAELAPYRTNKGDNPLIDTLFTLCDMSTQQGEIDEKKLVIELLGQFKYFSVERCLELLYKLYEDSDEVISNLAGDKLKSFAEYDLFVLENDGYTPYKEILDAIVKTNNSDFKSRLSFNIEILKKLTELSYQTTSWSKMTVTMHSGTLEPTPFYEKLRLDAIKQLIRAFKLSSSTTEKIQILRHLHGVFHYPETGLPNGANKSKMEDLIRKHTDEVIGYYEQIILTKGGKLKTNYPIVYEIEHQLSLLQVNKKHTPKSKFLFKVIREDDGMYCLFRALTGCTTDYEYEKPMHEADKVRDDTLDEYFHSITEKDVTAWHKKLNTIAGYKDDVDDWKLNQFKNFLSRIAKEKPELAEMILDISFKDRDSLYDFAGGFFYGFQISNRTTWWKYANQVTRNKDISLLEEILGSYEVLDTAVLVKEDFDFIENCINKKGRFAFISKGNDMRSFRFQIIRTLLHVSTAKDRWSQNLLLQEMQRYSKFLSSAISQLDFGLHSKKVSFSSWSKKNVLAISKILISVDSLEQNGGQQVLRAIGEYDYELMMSIFHSRFSMKRKTNFHPVPHHFEGTFKTFIVSHADYKKVILKWIVKTDTNRNYYLTSFLNEMGGTVFRDVLLDLAKSAKDKDLEKVLDLLPMMSAPDLDVCLQIVKSTNNEDILNSVAGKLCSPGSYGGSIRDNHLGAIYQSKLKEFQLVNKSTKNKRIRDFTAKLIADLKRSIKRANAEHAKKIEDLDAEDD